MTPSDATLPALKATNVLPAAGGADEETTDHAIATAPANVRSRFRAVSADDFEALAKATPQVRVERALALPNTQPGAGAGTTPGAVTVVLVPFAPFESSISTPIPLPSQIAAAVLRFLDQRRLVTTQVFVQPATFRKVTANVSLVVQPLAKINDTRSAVLLALQTFFHALVGGTDGQGWPFGGTIFFSQVFQQVLNVPGVSRVEQLLLSLDDGTPVDCRRFAAQRRQAAVLGIAHGAGPGGDHRISVVELPDLRFHGKTDAPPRPRARWTAGSR